MILTGEGKLPVFQQRLQAQLLNQITLIAFCRSIISRQLPPSAGGESGIGTQIPHNTKMKVINIFFI